MSSGKPSTHVGALVDDAEIPPWLRALTANVAAVTESVRNRGGDRTRWAQMLTRNRRSAAVLVLFAGSWEADLAPSGGLPGGPPGGRPGGLPADAEVLLTERAPTLRQHSGQVAFPGGAADPGDDFPIGTALREANEETGLDASGVHVVANLPTFPVPPSGFDVVPVVGYWARPSAVRVVDEGETARVARVSLHDLLAPENRFQVRRSILGGRVYQGPAFFVDGLLVWGFTGGLIAAISDAAGWDVPWDHHDIRPLEQMIELAGGREQSGWSAAQQVIDPEAAELAGGQSEKNGGQSEKKRGGAR